MKGKVTSTVSFCAALIMDGVCMGGLGDRLVEGVCLLGAPISVDLSRVPV